MILGGLVLAYVLVVALQPKPTDWTVTLKQSDKNPYGAYIVYRRLGDLFPVAHIIHDRLPAYNQLSDTSLRGTAYLLIAPSATLESEDVRQMLGYIARGNDVLISTYSLSPALADTLGLKLSAPVQAAFASDSVRINFTNKQLATDSGYRFHKLTLNSYFVKMDTVHTEVLGVNGAGHANFIRMHFGAGTLLVHAVPVCFSNYFMLFGSNSHYTASALSYLPRDIRHLYWDEYYQSGPGYQGGLLRFVLTHLYLRWAWWLALFAILMYVLFESKRRQRVIPIIKTPDNSSLDFITTVGSLYFERHDNKNISEKKIAYFLERVRNGLYLSTERLDQDFILSLARKTGTGERMARDLVGLIIQVRSSGDVSDPLLLQLNRHIDAFYEKMT